MSSTDKPDAMRVIGLRAENIKKLKAIDLTPNAFINRISGANGSGKTSILDAIEWALQGTASVPTHPVRKGAGKAVIQLDLGDLVVTRRFHEGGSRNGILALEAKDNKSRFQSPQQMLDELMGKISFDPLEFIRFKSDKQLEVLKTLVKLDVDLPKLEAENKEDYLLRRDLKKEVTAMETRRDAIKLPTDALPKQKVDLDELTRELAEIGEHNTRIERERMQRQGIELDQKSNAEKIRSLAAQITGLQSQLARAQEEQARTAKVIEKWTPLAAPKNAAELANAIEANRNLNAAIDRRNQRDAIQKEIETTESRIESLSSQIKARDERKTKAIEAAEFPVKGLAFGEDEVIYEGLPFNQVSNADQIRASVAIGMAANPKLRVMRIKDGSLLDDASMAIIAEMSHEHSFQVFCEVVDTSGKVGIYLEDGEVKAVNEDPLDSTPEPAAAVPAKRSRKKKEVASV